MRPAAPPAITPMRAIGARTPPANRSEAAAERAAAPDAGTDVVDLRREVGFTDRAAKTGRTVQPRGIGAAGHQGCRGDDGRRRGEGNEALAHCDLLHFGFTRSTSGKPVREGDDRPDALNPS